MQSSASLLADCDTSASKAKDDPTFLVAHSSQAKEAVFDWSKLLSGQENSIKVSGLRNDMGLVSRLSRDFAT